MQEVTATDVSSWQSTASQTFVPLVCTPLETHFGAQLTSIQLSTGVHLAHIRSGSLRIERTPRLAQNSGVDDLLISLQLHSTGTVNQHGRTAHLRPGTAALYEVNHPYALDQPQTGQDLLVLRIPRHTVGLKNSIISDLCGRTLDQSVPGLAAFFGYLQGIATSQTHLDHVVRDQFGSISTDLLSLMLHSFAGQFPALWDEERVLLKSIKNYIDRHLTDPQLSVARVADVQKISLRKLYDVFAVMEQRPATYIRSRRLQRARKLLAGGAGSRPNVAAIAIGCGFNDASTFTRAFAREYGQTPTQWVDQNHSE